MVISIDEEKFFLVLVTFPFVVVVVDGGGNIVDVNRSKFVLETIAVELAASFDDEKFALLLVMGFLFVVVMVIDSEGDISTTVDVN